MELGLQKKKKKRGSLISEEDDWQKKKKRRKEELQQDCDVAVVDKYGDGMAWFRGCLIGKGCFGSVFLATLKNPKSKYSSYPPIMAVKSAEVSVSSSIQKEREVLNNIRGCRNVIRCFGEEITNGDTGQMVYNLLLEYGSGGTLADLIKRSGKGLPEFDVKRYTRSILRGLRHIHRCGYVHCDLKPENILLVATANANATVTGTRTRNTTRTGTETSVANRFTAKIGDLGLAKRVKQSRKGKLIQFWRGTPMYFSPEVVTDGVQEAPSDIWAVGCIVLEMLTAKPPWDPKADSNSNELITGIGSINNSYETPFVPSTLSREAKSFLKGCFARKSIYRWTAEMLLAHPFLEGIDDVNADDDDDANNNNNSSSVEGANDAFDINAISSLITSDNDDDDNDDVDDDEISCSLYSDGFCSWSEEEDVDGTKENDITSSYSAEDEQAASTNVAYPVTLTVSSRV